MSELNRAFPTYKKGQSLVEFVFVSFLFVSLLLVTFNAILAFSVHQYVSYAAFMSARAFQAATGSPQQQLQNAQATLFSYLGTSESPNGRSLVMPGFNKVLAFNIESKFPSNADDIPYGVTPPRSGQEILVTFEVPLFELPLGSLSQQFGSIQLQARSYLGREPTAAECTSFFESFYRYYLPDGVPTATLPAVTKGSYGMDDNGC